MQECCFIWDTIDPNKTYDRKNFRRTNTRNLNHEVYHAMRVLDLITQKRTSVFSQRS